ncbi:MAG TPA: alpha/beta hydrolase [Acetobacteraceae bacterium]|nr:alpha/beta hydrolase [Acetobacteraceae bacterium]
MSAGTSAQPNVARAFAAGADEPRCALKANGGYRPDLEPATQEFVDWVDASGARPFSARSIEGVRKSLARLQSAPIGKPGASIRDVALPAGPGRTICARIVRPKSAQDPMPVVMFFHGGGWIAGDANTHDRLVREIAVGAHAAVVVVLYSRPPEAAFPLPIEEAYAATVYVAEHAASLNLDGTRLAVVGDGAGGNIAAGVAILAKRRHRPKLGLQVLFYPITGASFGTPSYLEWDSGPWLTRSDMEWLWNVYLPGAAARQAVAATPLAATIDELRGLPETLLITAEADVLRDEGEAFARKLSQASVRTTCTRYIGTIHDFVMLNALADTPAARAAIGQANTALRQSLA